MTILGSLYAIRKTNALTVREQPTHAVHKNNHAQNQKDWTRD